jgi:diguanylate cyclase (GGDEF)-like protein/PAS domain S-box-containing protein
MAKFDLNGTVLDISNKLCRFLCVTKNEIIGKKSPFFITDKMSGVQPEDILSTASTGTRWQGDLCIEDNHGISKWIHSSIYPELNTDYNVCGYSNIIQDISDRKAIEELSITDPLTKLHNRRHFDQVMEKELRLAARNQQPITLAIVDIDYFKKYNDHYGHPAGDQALIKVAHVFAQSLQRPNDYVFRLGGEEFGFIFSDFSTEESYTLLETIKKRIEMLKIEHQESDVSDYMTISIGARISSNDHRLDSNQLYIKADEALYQAKVKRNHVIVANQVKFEVMQAFI